MHSRHRTIDDMMNISDGINAHHYIQGQGVIRDDKGNYKWKKFNQPSEWDNDDLEKVINYAKEIKKDQTDITDMDETNKKKYSTKIINEINNFKDIINDHLLKILQNNNFSYTQPDFKNRILTKNIDYTLTKNKVDPEEKNKIKEILSPLIKIISDFLKPISPEQAVPYVEKIMDDGEIELKDMLGEEGYEIVKDKLGSDPLINDENIYGKSQIYDLKNNKIFLNAMDFESKISGLKTDLIYKYESLQKKEFNYMRHIIETLDPHMTLPINSKGVFVRSINTNFNVRENDTDGKYIWYADEYYWIDSIWEIKVNDEIFRYAVEYKYYTNNEDVVYNYGKQINYINSIKTVLEEKSIEMEENKLFKSAKDLSIVMSASKMGFDMDNLSIPTLEYKAMVLGMLSNLKQSPILDPKTGKIDSIKTQSSGGLNSPESQNNLFKGATILFVVAMQDTIIGLNYSDAIRDGKISLTNPLETTKLTFSAYTNKKNRKVKSIGLPPEIFTPITVSKVITKEDQKYKKGKELPEGELDKINKFVDAYGKENNLGQQTINKSKASLKYYLYPNIFPRPDRVANDALIEAWAKQDPGTEHKRNETNKKKNKNIVIDETS